MDRQWRRTENAIWNAFGSLLTQKSYQHITINDLIEEADIGRSTFYSHYATKDELLDRLCATLFPHNHPEVSKGFEQHYDIDEDDGRTILLRGFFHVRAFAAIIPLLMNQRNHSFFLPALRKEFRSILPRIQARFPFDRDTVHRQLTEGMPESLRLALLEDAFLNTLQWWVSRNLEDEPGEVCDYYCRIFNLLG